MMFSSPPDYSQHMLMSRGDSAGIELRVSLPVMLILYIMCYFLPTAEDVMRELAVPQQAIHSMVVSDGVVDDDNGYQHTQSVPTSSRGVWQITMEQADLVLSGKQDGSFLVVDKGGKSCFDPSFSSIYTHSISVV